MADQTGLEAPELGEGDRIAETGLGPPPKRQAMKPRIGLEEINSPDLSDAKDE